MRRCAAQSEKDLRTSISKFLQIRPNFHLFAPRSKTFQECGVDAHCDASIRNERLPTNIMTSAIQGSMRIVARDSGRLRSRTSKS